MDMTLKRTMFRPDGIFSGLLYPDGSRFCFTLEHGFKGLETYPADDSGAQLTYQPKIPPGVYTCKRRHSPHFGFDVFQVMDVPNCTFIEIHPGNFDKDSDGCICLGDAIAQIGADEMVTNSRKTFDKFMALQADVETFQLTVS